MMNGSGKQWQVILVEWPLVVLKTFFCSIVTNIEQNVITRHDNI